MTHVACESNLVQLWGHPYIHGQETAAGLPMHLVQELNVSTVIHIPWENCSYTLKVKVPCITGFTESFLHFYLNELTLKKLLSL